MKEYGDEIVEYHKITYSVIAGTSLALLLFLLSHGKLNFSLKLASYCFVFSLPSSITAYLCDLQRPTSKHFPSKQGVVGFISFIGLITMLIGITCITYNFSLIHMMIFVIISLIGIVSFIYYSILESWHRVPPDEKNKVIKTLQELFNDSRNENDD